MKPAIVVDKSFLQGSKAARIRELASSHRLLMSDALFYEMISNPKDRKLCFGKFPIIENPVDLVPHVGGLLKIELAEHRPCGKPSAHIENIRFQFNSALLSTDYQPPKESLEDIAEKVSELRSDVNLLIETVRKSSSLFPGTLSGSDTSRQSARHEAELLIAQNSNAISSFYSQLKANGTYFSHY